MPVGRRGATLWPFGDDMGQLDQHAWYASNSGGRTHPVGQKLPNAWGLYDLLGNVREWCTDGYSDTYYASSPRGDLVGAVEAMHRVFRGGSWFNDPRNCRSADRSGFVPAFRYGDLGFRVARAQG